MKLFCIDLEPFRSRFSDHILVLAALRFHIIINSMLLGFHLGLGDEHPLTKTKLNNKLEQSLQPSLI